MTVVPDRFHRRRSPLDNQPEHPLLSASQPQSITVTAGPGPSHADGRTAIEVGPGYWLVIDESSNQPQVEPRSADASHGLVRIRLAGDRARAVLAAGIAIDLHPAHFPVGRGAATGFRGIPVTLHRPADDVFDLYAPRSLAASLWEWLSDAVAAP